MRGRRRVKRVVPVTVVVLVAGAVLAGCTITHVDPNAAVTTPGSGPAGTASVATPDPEITSGVLDNGLRYMIRENDNPGRSVSMRLVVDAGSVLQSPDQDGVAHFLEHMMFNGTEKFPKNELVATLRKFGSTFGADINASTSYDETVYELTMPTDDDAVVSTGLDVLEQWLSAATLDPAEVEAERGVVLDEWRTTATGASGRVFDEAQGLMLGGTPYDGHDPIGAESSITAMNVERLRQFYDDWYRPDDAALVIVGDIDAGKIEAQINEQFSTLTARGASPERPAITADVPAAADARVLTDPDVPSASATVLLPRAIDPLSAGTDPDGNTRDNVLDQLASDMISTRLQNAASRGDAPYDDVNVNSSAFVRALTATAISVDADAASLEASTRAVFDELERVRRYGFTDAEFERASKSLRSAANSEFDGRDSRQDADFAQQYVAHLLEGTPVPSAEDQLAFEVATIDAATPVATAARFVDLLDTTHPQVLVVAPQADAAVVADASVFVAQITSMGAREVAPPADDASAAEALMTAPEPTVEVSKTSLGGNNVEFVDPVVLEFANGVRVSLNKTEIAKGQVAVEGRSPGGLAALADADVPAAQAISSVMGDSGVGGFDRVALDSYLSDKDVGLSVGVDSFTEGLQGNSSTADLEAFMQLLHLQLADPVVDPLAVERYVKSGTEKAADPSFDPGYAEYVALGDARYDDPRFLPPTVESLASVTGADIDRVFRDRFGDASDWSFAFSGDFDIDKMTDLARRYLGTLPATGRVEAPVVAEPAPPAGVVERTVPGGTGSQANVSLLFTEPATTDRRDDVAARFVTELVTNRMTDVVREKLGETYSPYASVAVGAGPTPFAETYVSTTTSAELVGDVRVAMLEQLTDLRKNGPTDTEFEAASAAVKQQLVMFSNEQINDEVLNVLVDPAANKSLDQFTKEYRLADTMSVDDIRGYLTEWIDPTHLISVTVTPNA